MTESFEDAMVYARAIMADCDIPLLDRLQRAHEHEIDAVRDPQRIGGRHAPDSFVYAIEQLREFRWQHATNDDDAIPYINGVARAHEHEMEQLRRLRFREGYEAGQRSMDAEHYQLKLRLQGLRFGDGSHENLSRLAYAIYPCPTGWGKESCEGLRDKLIELLGGVHEIESDDTASGACDADCNCGHGDETAVRITDELRKFKGHINAGLTPEMVLALRAEVNCIADHIDEQHNELCEEFDEVVTVLHDTDEKLTRALDERDEARAKVLRLDSEVSDLLDLLRDAVVDFEYASYSWDYAAIVSENITMETERNRLLKERDELQKKLDAIAEVLNGEP